MPFTWESIRSLTAEEISAHMALKTAINSGHLSASIGQLIALGQEFEKSAIKAITKQNILIAVSRLQGAMSKCCALICDSEVVFKGALSWIISISLKSQNIYLCHKKPTHNE